MRGRDPHAALKFTSTRRARSEEPAVPGYLYAYALSARPEAADEYDARRGRLIPPVYQAQPRQSPIPASRAGAYRHVVRRPGGGWGHVPSGDLARVERKERLEKLRRDVKQEC